MSRSDKELADAVVALGAEHNDARLFMRGQQAFNEFLTDWRVAGALMEKAAENDDQVLVWKSNDRFICDLPNVETERLSDMARSESLSRAVIEACVEALT